MNTSRVEETIELDDGARLYAVTEGEGRPIVLCHGGPGDGDTLDALAAMVTDVACVHRYHQRACGRSSGGRPFTMSRWIADLDELRRHWGHARWVVGGHSFGAALALAYALAHPDRTEAIVYVSCVVRLAGQPDWHEQYRRNRLARIPPEHRQRFSELRRQRDVPGVLPPKVAAELRTLSLRTDFADPALAHRLEREPTVQRAAVNDDVNRELGDDFVQHFAAPTVRRQLRSFERPVLLVHGDADPRPLAAVQALAEELAHGELVTLAGIGHFPYLEAPDALRKPVRRFLASL